MIAKNAGNEMVEFDMNVEPIDPASVHKVRLQNGTMMPVAAFGTFHSDWAQDYMKDATLEAIRIGWRHIDTARAYENEHDVGEAIRKALKRGYIASTEELFVTGKLWNGHMKPKDVAPALDNTLKALGLDKIDLYLTHWPWPNVHTPGCGTEHRNPDAVPYIHEDFMETWEEILKLKKKGKIINVGTSNHTRAIMKLLLRDVSDNERPAVNQMELHPLFQQTELRRYFQSEALTCVGYMSLGSPNRPERDKFREQRADMMDPTIREIAGETGISPAQVGLNWAYQRENKSGGYVAMATRSDWIKENLKAATADILTPAQMLRISGDGTKENPGIDANNRLIYGQVFLWPEAEGDWRVLWDDSQVFETRKNYKKFKKAWKAYKDVKIETTFRGQ